MRVVSRVGIPAFQAESTSIPHLSGLRAGRGHHSPPGPNQFQRGPIELSHRGTATDDTPAFVVEDGNYLSARWPGDAYLFGRRFISLLG